MANSIPDPDFLILEVPSNQIRKVLQIIGESQWRPSCTSDYWFRVDPMRPEMSQFRHVHIAHKKHINTKTKQVAWNTDGTRHDKGSFADNFKGLEIARDIAREVLDSPSSITFESLNPVRKLKLLLEEIEQEIPPGLVCLHLKAVPV